MASTRMASIRTSRQPGAVSGQTRTETRQQVASTRATSHAVRRPARPGKTSWERMRNNDISLAHLSDLLATEKAASGKSAQTVDWCTGVIARYAEWLVAQDLAHTLGNFTLEQVRTYIVALQGLRARALRPCQPR